MGVGDAGDGNLSSIWTPNGKMTTTAMIIVTALFILLFFHLYSRLFLRPREPYSRPRPPVIRRRPLVFVETRPATISSPASPRGLDPIVLESTSPVFVFHNDGEIGIVCAVCLGEIEEGELARIVPKCGHGFHVECIDMWLASHATCPLCRAVVEPIGKRGLGIDSKAPRGELGGERATSELDLERGIVAQWAPPVTSRRERE